MPPQTPSVPSNNTDPSPIADPFSQIVEKVKGANNVLVTVSANPSVDQLAACIGLTLALNKQGKHATAVYSGKTPSVIEFLEPEKTLEPNTDSLRDFIIALDKSKADKLRYKVEDDVVKIFITPYRTSISEKDFDFSQGDFNVDAVVAIGVHDKKELDQAIVAHGRILHDATVTAINTSPNGDLASINWIEGRASSLCEMVSDLIATIDKDTFDTQIATALLTGMVAETDRFGNEKASPHTMTVSGTLMAAGASPQLVASKLKPQNPENEIPEVVESDGSDDGMIQIEHDYEEDNEDELQIDEQGEIKPPIEETSETDRPKAIFEAPSFGGQLTANSVPESQQYAASTDPLSQTEHAPLLNKAANSSESVAPVTDQTLEDIEKSVDSPHVQQEDVQPQDPTLSDLEKSVNSPHLQDASVPVQDGAPPVEQSNTSADSVPSMDAPLPMAPPSDPVPPPPSVDYAKDAVQRAVNATNSYRPEPIQALNAQDVGLNLAQNITPPTTEADNSTPQGPPPPPVPPPFMPNNPS